MGSRRGDWGLRITFVLGVLLTVGGVAGIAYLIEDDSLPTYGPSMRPTLKGPVNLDIDAEAYARAKPRIGDIVAAQAPADLAACADPQPRSPCARVVPGYSFLRVIKRVVAGPGDSVAFAANGELIRNGTRVDEPYIRRCVPSICALPEAIVVPPAHLFLAGDNRPQSSDSRDWGPLPFDAIDGMVVLP